MFTNMAFFGCVFLPHVELYIFSLYKHAAFRLSADVKQTLWSGHTHTHALALIDRLTHFPELNWTNQNTDPLCPFMIWVWIWGMNTHNADVPTSIKDTQALSECSCVARCAFDSGSYKCSCTLRVHSNLNTDSVASNPPKWTSVSPTARGRAARGIMTALYLRLIPTKTEAANPFRQHDLMGCSFVEGKKQTRATGSTH